jgi:iron complex transport system permease protein
MEVKGMEIQKKVMPKERNRAGLAILVLLVSIIALGLAIILSVTSGAAKVSLNTIIDAVIAFDPSNSQQLLVRDMRIPRALCGVLIGAALAVAGAMMQGITRNPLADSGLMGLSSGAGLFLAFALVFLKGASYTQIVILTFLGAALGAGCVHFITSLVPGGNRAIKLVLAGATVSTLFSAISQAIAITANASQNIMFWIMGNVSGTSWQQLRIAGPIITLSILIAIAISRRISIMSMGEEMAIGIGVNTKVTGRIGTILIILLSGTSFALCGSITFVGIMIPHFVRFLVGPDYRFVIPLSAVQGGLLVVAADYFAKTINQPAEIPLGAVISLVGVPIFLYYARKERGKA